MHREIQTDQSSDRQTRDQVPRQNHLGQIARDYGERYIKTYRPPIDHIKFIRALRVCKTPLLGGNTFVCQNCSHTHYVYFSCGHSRCPICQSIKREQIADKMSADLLSVPYVHLVTTMPHAFNGLARRNQNAMYNLLFRSTNATVNAISLNKAHLGAKTGMISVLHTWGSDMKYHVHVHSLLTFGGIDNLGDWQYPKHRKRFCRNSKFRHTFREIYLAGLKELFDKGALDYHQIYDEVVLDVKDKQWTLFATHPTMETKTIELYIARYINRIAVSNRKLNYIKEHEEVHLLYNDYKKQKAGEVAPKGNKSMPPLEFLNQLLMHLPPPYFQRIRRYGLHASAVKWAYKETIENKLRRNGRTVRTVLEIITHLMKNNVFVCDKCGSEEIVNVPLRADKEWKYRWMDRPKIRSPDGHLKYSRSTI